MLRSIRNAAVPVALIAFVIASTTFTALTVMAWVLVIVAIVHVARTPREDAPAPVPSQYQQDTLTGTRDGL